MGRKKAYKKRVPSSTPGRFFVARIGAIFFKLLYLTLRKKVSGQEFLEKSLASDRPIILAVWHNRCLLFIFDYLRRCPQAREIYLGVSGSRDGELATGVLARLGVNVVTGSASKGGTRALRELVKLSRSGEDLAFVPDGPRGPVYVVKQGVLATSRMSGVPILPISWGAKHKIRYNSWDRLILPLPFSRVNYIYGTPLVVPRDCDEAGMDSLAQDLATELHRISDLAGRFH